MKHIKLTLVGILSVLVLLIPFLNNSETRAMDKQILFYDLGKSLKELSSNQGENLKSLNTPSDLDEYQLKSKQLYYKMFHPNLNTNEVEEIALNELIEETSITSKAAELNLLPTSEEINIRISEFRKRYNNSNEEHNQKVKENISNLIKGLGISEEEYWTTFLPNGYVYTISAERLYEFTTKGVEKGEKQKQVWETSKQKIIEEYKSKNKSEINRLKNAD
jgi:hypothetical protein